MRKNIFVGKTQIITVYSEIIWYEQPRIWKWGIWAKVRKGDFQNFKKKNFEIGITKIISCRITWTFSLKYRTIMYMYHISQRRIQPNTYCPWLQCQIYEIELNNFARTSYTKLVMYTSIDKRNIKHMTLYQHYLWVQTHKLLRLLTFHDW